MRLRRQGSRFALTVLFLLQPLVACSTGQSDELPEELKTFIDSVNRTLSACDDLTTLMSAKDPEATEAAVFLVYQAINDLRKVDPELESVLSSDDSNYAQLETALTDPLADPKDRVNAWTFATILCEYASKYRKK